MLDKAFGDYSMRTVFDRLQAFIDKETAGIPSLKVLEAGCGSTIYIRFQQKMHLVGIDISERQLERNQYLNERIIGDIQDYTFPPSSFDVIVCVNVMEHLSEPELALRRFSSAVRTNGLIVLIMPNVLSVKGLITKFLPHRMHQLAYKYLNSGGSSKGKIDIAPFKTYLKFSISPNAIKKFARELGLETAYFELFDISSTRWLQQKKYAHIAYRMIRAFFKFVSFNRIDYSEYILVLKKSC